MVMEHRVSRLEGAFEELSERLGDVLTELRRMNDRIDETQAENNRRFDAMNARLDAQQADTNARFDRLQADMARQFKEQQADTNERFDRQQADMARQFKEQNDRIDRHHAENTQRIDAQNRLIVAVTGLALTAAGVVIGLVAAGVV